MRYQLVCLGVACAIGSNAFAADVTVLEEIVCKVNGDIITRTQLEHDRKDAENELRRQGLAGNNLQQAVHSAARDALARRIDSLLLRQKGKELDLKVDGELTKQIANIQRQTGIADPQKFQDYVHEQTGMPWEDYKNDLLNQILVNRVVHQEIGGSLKVKREELEKYYTEHKDEFQRKEQIYLRMIFISTENRDAAGIALAERKARDVARRAKAGEKFNELAQANSDAGTAASGGEMPAFAQNELRKDVLDAVWDKDKGYVTDALKTPFGFEIYRVEAHEKAGVPDFEEVQAQVEDKVLSPRMGPAYRDYLTKLRVDAFLEIKAGYEDSAAAPGKNTEWADVAQLTPKTTTKEEVAAKGRKKKLLWAIPVPGTNTKNTGTSSSQ
jgi:parvulin-like peptidyl-prolyl isomerase